MKSLLALIFAGVLIGALVWLLLGSGDVDTTPDEGYAPSVGARSGSGDGAESAMEADNDNAGLGGRGTGVKPRRRAHSPFKPHKPRTGTLQVLPLGPEDVAISADDCTVSLETVNPAGLLGKLGKRDRETGVWHFDRIPIGPIRVVVTGDQLIAERVVVRIRENTLTYKKVVLEFGALIRFKAQLLDGTVPAQVTFELINHKGRAAQAYWQVRGSHHHSSPLLTNRFTQYPQGVVFGVSPGVYTLRARTADSYTAAREITVAAGDTADVALELER